MRPRSNGIPVLISVIGVAVLACEEAGRSGGNPVQPPAPPTITSIEPADAAPGDRITIRGSHLAGEGLAVAFDGVQAQVISATSTAIHTVVPDVGQGEHEVTVTSDGRMSSPFRYGVAAVTLPTILRIEPAGAFVGDEITIVGDFLMGPQVPTPIVLVGGVATLVKIGLPSRLVVDVPVLPRGRTTAQVRSGANASAEFPFEVFHSPPVVSSVAPNPARAGLLVTIEGQYLAGPEAAVLVDGSPVAIRPSAGNTEMIATIPPVTIGTHRLQVRVEGDLAAPVPLVIDDFDGSGIYDVRSVVLSSRPAGPCPAVGSLREYTIELIDRRPDLTLRIGLGPRNLNGGIDSRGRISVSAFTCNPLLCGFDPGFRVLGRVDRRDDGSYEIDATIDWGDACGVTDHATGSRR